MKRIILLCLIILYSLKLFAQPANDNCINASEIIISNSGYGVGVFNSDTINISNATMESGETIHPAIFALGLNQKSVWYKFTLSTNRKLRVTLKQPGSVITAGDVGFTVYKTNTCLPLVNDLSTKLTPIGTFGNSFHPCVDSGEYLIQVSANTAGNGSIFIELEIENSDAMYDDRDSAYEFNVLNQSRKHVQYNIDCHSTESIDEVCNSFLDQNFTKTSWHTFTTPEYFDYIAMLIGSGSGSYFTNSSTNHVIGYNLYKGDARTTSLTGLTIVDGCDTMVTTGYRPGFRTYKCGDILDTNTTYSLQLFFKEDFNYPIRVGFFKEGGDSTRGPIPILSQLSDSNQLGILPIVDTIIRVRDRFACNSRHDTNPCGNTKAVEGITRSNINYNLSSYFTFTINEIANVHINTPTLSGIANCKNRYIRIFSDSITNNCNSLDTLSLYDEFATSKWLDCLPAGTYTIQVMGSDDFTNITNTAISTSNSSSCFYSNFGQEFELAVTIQPVQAENRFSLFQPGAFDSINDFQSLSTNTIYTSIMDTFGCSNAVLPGNSACASNDYNKAMYRQFVVADSGSISMTALRNAVNKNGVTHYYRYNLYQGDANALTQAQNAWSYPDTFSGLIPYTPCIERTTSYNNVCILPDTYTFVTYGNEFLVGEVDRPSFTFRKYQTKFHSPSHVEDITDSIYSSTGYSSYDTFSCLNNAVVIDGFSPCNNATKAIYREFYLSQDAFINIQRNGNGTSALFSGRLSMAGFNGLTNIWSCFTSSKSTVACETLPAGWYTVVSYGIGSSYDDPFGSSNNSGRDVGASNRIRVTLTYDCTGPKFNRPYKAAVDSITGNPFLIEWNAAADTGSYPITGMDYTLPTEFFNCTVDTPFSSHPINSCNNSNNRVAYYTFELTQESYVMIYTEGNLTKVYNGDVRIDSLQFATATPLQECMQNQGRIEICKMQPGVYTLVIFKNTGCSNVTPKIYIDKVGISRFDHAINAYDFGVIPADSSFYDGKIGDVNPLNPSRAPSNDFFYCTTGAQLSDPTDGACRSIYNPNVYNQPDTNNVLFPESTTSTNIVRRNLWYTFQIDQPGWITVKVNNKTANRMDQVRFAIYESGPNGHLPFDTLRNNNLVDSTINQGLRLLGTNQVSGNYCNAIDSIRLFVEPCDFDTLKRYYVLVDNRNPSYIGQAPDNNNMRPNHQVEVSIKVDSINLPNTLFDFYSTAYDLDTIGIGTHFGEEDNFTCATASFPYPSTLPNCAQKTLWYKFTVANNVTGVARIGIWLDSVYFSGLSNANHIRLYREIVAGDSTSNGLIEITTSSLNHSSRRWRQTCVSQGTYYLVLTGCERIDERVYPEIVIEESPGDYCNAPLITNVTGQGQFTESLTVNCHTIGTDYGEFAPILSCPPNGITEHYKTSWFRIDITGTDTLDITTYITNNTNAASSQIQYRMMTGDCNAMQEQSCVLDAQTQNTYQCMIPGNSYYIQVFTPKYNDPNRIGNASYLTTGTISLNLNAVNHLDTCAPINECMVNASFIPQFDCSLSDSASFINYSIFGNAIDYLWDFGYNNEISTEVSPKFRYPALSVADTYTVTLRVINTSCADTAFSTQEIIIPPRPEVNLGKDTLICTSGSSLTLDASTHIGSTYLWNDNSTDSVLIVNNTGKHTYKVEVSFENCMIEDSISVFINPIDTKPIDTFFICGIGDTVSLNANRNNSEVNYLWNTGSVNFEIIASSPGWYWADMIINGCTIRDSFLVKLNSDTLDILGNDTSICLSSSGYLLDASSVNANTYLWSDNSTNNTLLITDTGLYWVEVTIEHCTFTDSIHILAAPLISIQVNDTICYGDSYILPSHVSVDSSGIYYDTLTSSNLCDSVIITHLFRRDPIEVNIYDTVCNNQLPFVWNGINVDLSNTSSVKFNTLNNDGCDSTSLLHLTILSTDSTTLIDSVCHTELPFSFSGFIFTESGTKYDTLTNVNGCDSIIKATLHVWESYNDTIREVICAGDTFRLNNQDYYISGNYTQSLRTISGCDSIIMLELFVKPWNINRIYDTICQGDNYILPSNNRVSDPDIYYDTFSVSNNCDSIVITHLWVRDSVQVTFYDTICSNQLPYSWNGINIQNGGVEVARFLTKGKHGCDSSTTLNLTVNQISIHTIEDSLCRNDLPYNFFGRSITTSGVYHDTFSSNLGCDSIVSLHFEVLETYSDTLQVDLCEGEHYTFDNKTYDKTGFYSHTFSTSSGCDSMITIQIIVNAIPAAPNTQSPITYCVGASASSLEALGTDLKWYSDSIGGIGVSTPPIPNTNTAGLFLFYVTQSINGCESPRAVIEVIIEEKPIIDFVVQPDRICQDEEVIVSFTGHLPDGFTLNWDWDSGNAIGSGIGPFTVSWDNHGIKEISAWIENSNCSSDIIKKTVEVHQTPDMPIIELPEYACILDTITINGHTNIADVSFHWTGGGSPTGSELDFEHSWESFGMKHYTLYTVLNGCPSPIAIDSIWISDLPEAKIIIEKSEVCQNEIITLSASHFETNFTYTWSPSIYFPDGMDFESADVKAQVMNSGYFYLHVSNEYGCENMDSLYLSTKHCCDMFVPNAFSPNNDGLNDNFELLGEVDQEIKEFSIYNRWGERLFHSQRQSIHWNGRYNGVEADVGVYFYYLKYLCSDGNEYIKRGEIHLIR